MYCSSKPLIDIFIGGMAAGVVFNVLFRLLLDGYFKR